MKTINGILIEGKLSSIISTYQIKIEGFEDFTAEAHLFALLEWSKYLRPDYSQKDRLKYLYEKCLSYDKPYSKIYPKFTIVDTPYGCGYAVIVEEEEEDTNPF
jgi:hypothetical protein